VLSVSSTTTVAILTGTQLGLAVPDGDPGRLLVAVATLSALVGAALILAAVLRLGFVANFISAPVLTGFKAGIGLVIVLDQVPKLLGVHFPKEGFFQNLVATVQSIPDAGLPTVAVRVPRSGCCGTDISCPRCPRRWWRWWRHRGGGPVGAGGQRGRGDRRCHRGCPRW
jgi:MFS superfamily sulfate permease-like transporter